MSKAVRSSSDRKDTINDGIDQKDKAIVLFYTTWCPFSLRFLPIFEEYAKSNPRECMSIIVDDLSDVCEKYAIDYYPTVILFKKGKVYRRLDSEPGVGLNEKQLKEFTEKS